ncbi:unnamed protein product [Larinioides sclopetarius]|uniref:Sushi domain-containing protein n=1 Tax=Larinioides sclopetarius TaxID=280406 RepID=A0AAV2B1A3_9ARAC
MYIKQSRGFRALSVVCLAGWMLLIPPLFCANRTCPPPDFPDGGRYEPLKAEYEVGEAVSYFCNRFRPMMIRRDMHDGDKTVICKSNGDWSEETPFCETWDKVKNPVTSSKELESTIQDGNRWSCFETRNDTEEILQFSLDPEALVYAVMLCWLKSKKMVTVASPIFVKTIPAYSDGCVKLYHPKDAPDVKIGNITVQISSNTTGPLQLCEVRVFTKSDKWCGHPPKNYVLNGQLAVNRSKAVLLCNEGFREKEGRRIYATCKNNKWSYLSLECVEGKPRKNEFLGCNPPDFPERGQYEPKKAKYEVGQTIIYLCLYDRFITTDDMISLNEGIVSACELNGKWSEVVPFCDTPTKLRNPFTDIIRGSYESILVDGDSNTCVPFNETFVLGLSFDHEANIYFGMFCFRKGKAEVKITVFDVSVYTFPVESVNDNITRCSAMPFQKTDKTDFVIVEVIPNSGSIILCELQFYSMDEDTPQEDTNISAIVVGLVIVIVFLILFGLTVFLIRTKKIRGICALHEHRNRNNNISLPISGGCNTTELPQIETTTI